jgi:E-phenylitaconyl-CoA hydratase
MPVQFDTQEAVATVTLDRPAALNALDIDSLRELRAHLLRFQEDDSLRALVLTGSGDKAFCVGADLKGTRSSPAPYAQAMFRDKASASELGLYIRLMDLSDLEVWKPMIAAVHGFCLGGGLELALQCDLRIASEGAQFGLPEVAVGSIPGVSGVHRLTRAIARAPAMQMVMTGARIDAAQALGWGLVSETVARDQLLPRAMELAQRIAGNAPLALQSVKKLSLQTAHLSDAQAQELTELHWGALRDTRDRQEGRAAFAERRPPHFVGQ